jgi:hypothetical protein
MKSRSGFKPRRQNQCTLNVPPPRRPALAFARSFVVRCGTLRSGAESTPGGIKEADRGEIVNASRFQLGCNQPSVATRQDTLTVGTGRPDGTGKKGCGGRRAAGCRRVESSWKLPEWWDNALSDRPPLSGRRCVGIGSATVASMHGRLPWCCPSRIVDDLVQHAAPRCPPRRLRH